MKHGREIFKRFQSMFDFMGKDRRRKGRVFPDRQPTNRAMVMQGAMVRLHMP